MIPEPMSKVLRKPHIKNVILKRCKYIAPRPFRNEPLPITAKILSVVREGLKILNLHSSISEDMEGL